LRSRFLVVGLAVLAVFSGGTAAFASPNGVVVSEFQFRGADGNDEFIELLNTSTNPVNIGGWRLQGCAAGSGAATARVTVPAGVTLAAGQRYLFAHQLGSVVGDATYSIGISDEGGARITLSDGSTVVDGVGSSEGTLDQCREGVGLVLPTTNGSNAFERKNAGTQDTDDNVADFVGPKVGTPQGTGAPPGPALATIQQVQGTGHVSPLVGQSVIVEGIVTARRTPQAGVSAPRGFWMQDPTPDADSRTSEAVFVFLGSSGTTPGPLAQVGDFVRVTGAPGEFRPSAATNLTVTQLNSSNANVERVSSGNAVPLPVVIGVGVGGVLPPTEIIDNDTNGSVETEPPTTTFDPAQDAIDFWESYEGMLLQADNAAVVNETESFGEITLLPDNGAWATGLRTPSGGILARSDYGDFNPERFTVDDEVLRDLAGPTRPGKAMPDINVGAQIVGAVVGPLDYSFANFKIQALMTPAFFSDDLQPETTAAPVDQEITFATFNVENLSVSPSNPANEAKFDRLAAMIVNNLRSPDLIGIEEVQDDNATTNNGVVDATQTWTKLVAEIQQAGGPLYEFSQINPVNNEDGGAPGGNIRVGFLYRTDRGLSFINRPGGDSTTPTQILSTASGPQLSFSPGRVDPENDAWFETRKPLAGEFRARGKKLFVVVNHFSSKTDDQPLMGRFQPPTRFSEMPDQDGLGGRHAQAAVVNEFVKDILAVDPEANVIVLGDINDFEFSRTVEILEGDGELFSAIKTLPANERYSYVFEGNSQVLDQILLSPNLDEQFLYTYDVVHANSEFAGQASDHEPSLVRIRLTGRPTPKP
jgi:predicted extracellular nuclease